MGENGKCLGGENGKCTGGPMKCLLIIGAILYVISPIDFLPELFLGPIGLIDDVVALIAAWKLSGGGDLLGKMGDILK